MKISFVIFCVISLVRTIATETGNKHDNGTENEEERWTWGYVDITNSHLQDTTTTSSTPPSRVGEDAEDSCSKQTPPMPDFSAPGRRISEQKCYEYIWSIKNRLEIRRLTQACWQQKNILSIIGVNRRDALSGEFPHMGAIGWKAVQGTWIFKCGSCLISTKFALTAAHCSKTTDRDTTVADPDPKIVRFGDKNIIDNFSNGVFPTDANIKTIIIHPQYTSPKKYFDIALIELHEELIFNSNVQPACLWKSFDIGSTNKATITGWGVIESSTAQTSPTLQVAEVDMIDSKTCDDLLRPHCNRLWCGVQDTQLCAGNLSGSTDTCQGDSGGPLQMKINLPSNAEGAIHYVIGVTSFGFGCALENKPGVYTRVSSFLDWIENIVWK